MTEKIYFDSSYITDFQAKVLKIEKYNDNYAVILDKTAFYPEGGGQPRDVGTINGSEVLDLVIKGGEILHILNEAPKSEAVSCSIDFATRLDHMQQHAGQHIISACFLKLYDAATNSFHMGKESTTIEINIDSFDKECASKVEDMANDIIYKNLPIKANIYDSEQLKSIPLRKQPKVKDNIRVIEVEGIDYSPCGGTHVKSTGEIGMIKIKKWEKCKDWYRIEFVCGGRALRDYRFKNDAINSLGAKLSLRDFEVEAGVEKLIGDNVELQKQIGELKQNLNKYIVQELIENSIEIDEYNVVIGIFSDKTMNDLKHMSQLITAYPLHIALLVNKQDNVQVLFSKSNDIKKDVNKLMKAVLPIINGKGGGSPMMAQGGGSIPDAIDQFIEKAIEELKK